MSHNPCRDIMMIQELYQRVAVINVQLLSPMSKRTRKNLTLELNDLKQRIDL